MTDTEFRFLEDVFKTALAVELRVNLFDKHVCRYLLDFVEIWSVCKDYWDIVMWFLNTCPRFMCRP